MIELNLLPDVKLEYIKAQRTKRLVISVSIVVASVSVLIMVLLLVFDLSQKKYLSDLNRDISNETSTLQSKPNINTILTVQNQLRSLTSLHNQKPAASRLFSSYLNQLTPATVEINDFQIDFTKYTATITGTGDSLTTINQYIDTLKSTTFTIGKNKTSTKAFSDIVLTQFGLNSDVTDPNQAVSYTISLSFDNTIFNITDNINLSVPSLVVTRSQVPQPNDLFSNAPSKSSNGGTH